MNNTQAQHPLFREVQYFREHTWIWLLILPAPIAILYVGIQQLFYNNPIGQNPMPNEMLVVFVIIFGFGLPWFFYAARLVTEVRPDGLYVKFLPFHLNWKIFRLPEIKNFEAVTYKPILDYGGWGIRYGRKGRAYNVSGNRGLQLEFTNGKRLLIGSQKPDQLANAIQGATKR